MEYDFRAIEQKWQRRWAEQKTDRVEVDKSRPKYYVLDMFPYPSGAGLHVGHPLGYIASDIYSRYKRLRGFNAVSYTHLAWNRDNPVVQFLMCSSPWAARGTTTAKRIRCV